MSVHLCWRFGRCEAQKHGAPMRLYVRVRLHGFLLGWGQFRHWGLTK